MLGDLTWFEAVALAVSVVAVIGSVVAWVRQRRDRPGNGGADDKPSR